MLMLEVNNEEGKVPCWFLPIIALYKRLHHDKGCLYSFFFCC